jgi:class 3 adenylate cyclase
MYLQKLREAQTDAFLARIEAELNAIWRLGRNVIIGWTRDRDLLLFLTCANHHLPAGIAAYASMLKRHDSKKTLLADLAADPRFKLHRVLLLPADEPYLKGAPLRQLIRRYGITRLEDRAVVLFDIVGYSKLTDLEQVAQLNSLSFSVNVALKRLNDRGLAVDLGRSTTGDGFYLWNRAIGQAANERIGALAALALADNTVQRHTVDEPNVVPKLRTAIHIGTHFEFYQAAGVTPETREYIVGDTTITLARMLEKAAAGQLSVGDCAGSKALVDAMQGVLDRLTGIELSGAIIGRLNIALTGGAHPARFVATDKHGHRHGFYNGQLKLAYGGEFLTAGIGEDEVAAPRAA